MPNDRPSVTGIICASCGAFDFPFCIHYSLLCTHYSPFATLHPLFGYRLSGHGVDYDVDDLSVPRTVYPGAGEFSPRLAEGGLGPGHRSCDSEGSGPGKILSPAQKRRNIETVCSELGVSQRHACKTLHQSRSTQRYELKMPQKDRLLVGAMREQANKRKHRRYGYRRITALLNNKKGWWVNHKRVERIWRREGLKVPKKQPKRGRLWLNDGSCIRLRPEHKDHVWSYDFMVERTSDGRAFRILNIIDEFTRECLATKVARKMSSEDVIDELFKLFIFRGIPEHIRSDNGPEFTAKAVRKWLSRLGVKTLFIEPGSPWENGYIESFNGKMRDELINREISTTLEEAKVLIEQWRREYNQVRPHSAKKYRPPAPEAILSTVAS